MPYKKSAKRAVKKFAKKVYKKVVYPYVRRKYGRSNRMKLYQEVAAIKKLINVEKKYVDVTSIVSSFAQVNGAGEGALTLDITPTIPQGSANGQRNGNSVKITGMYLRAQIRSQANQINLFNYAIDIVQCKGKPQVTSEILTGMYDADPISAFRDYNAPRNPNQMTDYMVISSKKRTLKPDTITGQTGYQDIHTPLKVNRHIRWDNTGTLQEGQFFMICRGNVGDIGAALTGVNIYYTIRYYYVDN